MSIISDMKPIMLQKKKVEESKVTGELIERWVDVDEIHCSIYRINKTKYIQDVKYNISTYVGYTYTFCNEDNRLYDKEDNKLYSIIPGDVIRGMITLELEVIDING